MNEMMYLNCFFTKKRSNSLKKLLSEKIVMAGLLILGVNFCINAQQSLNSSGAEAKGAGGQASYSVGQVAYTSITSASGSVAQGVQQTYVIEPVGNQESVILGARIIVFPNPAMEHLILQIDSELSKQWVYHLLDLQGTSVLQGLVNAGEHLLQTASLPAGTYILEIKSYNSTKIQNFKVIKI
jgi:hypothetical protein